MEILEKAKTYSLSLSQVSQRLEEGLRRIDEETLPAWKVEMAVHAAEGFLKNIFHSLDSLDPNISYDDVMMEQIFDVDRPLIPIALGIALQRGMDVGLELEGLKRAAAYWKARERKSLRERLLSDFLKNFRSLATSVAEGKVPANLRQIVSGLVGRYFSDILISEPLRAHVEIALTDILRIIAVSPEEADKAIDRGLKLFERFRGVSLFDDDILRGLGFEDEHLGIVTAFLGPAAALQYYVNRLAAGRAHNILWQIRDVIPQIAESLGRISEENETYFGLLEGAAFGEKEYPLMRSSSDFYQVLATRGIVTAKGYKPFTINTSPGYRMLKELAILLGVRESASAAMEVLESRRFPLVIGDFVLNLWKVLKFIRDQWNVIAGDDGVLSEEDVRNLPTNLAGLVTGLGLMGKSSEEAHGILSDKINNLRERVKSYAGDTKLLIENSPHILLSLSDLVGGALGGDVADIMSHINKLVAEIAVYYIKGKDDRQKFIGFLARHAFFVAVGGHLAARVGMKPDWRDALAELGATAKTRSRRDPAGSAMDEIYSEVIAYIIDGPTAEADPVVWFRNAVAGLELIVSGDTAIAEGKEYWNERFGGDDRFRVLLTKDGQINWAKFAQKRREEGRFLGLGSVGWRNLFQKLEGTLSGLSEKTESERVKIISDFHSKARGQIVRSWSSLADRIGNSAANLMELLFYRRDPNVLLNYIRLATLHARIIEQAAGQEPLSLEEEVGEGRRLEEVLGEEPEVGVLESRQAFVGEIVSNLASLWGEGADLTPYFEQIQQGIIQMLGEDVWDEFIDALDDVLLDIYHNPQYYNIPDFSDDDLREFIQVVASGWGVEVELPPKEEEKVEVREEAKPLPPEEAPEPPEPEVEEPEVTEEVESPPEEEIPDEEKDEYLLLKFRLLGTWLPTYS